MTSTGTTPPSTTANPQDTPLPRAPNIAFVGTEGSGKTVLVTTLAKRLSTIDSRGVFLNPQGVKTLKYVEKVWQTLQSGEWPPSTPPGELFELRWKFQIVGEMECNVRLVDMAGQDLRLLFGDEQILSPTALPANLKAVADYCHSADIVLFVINLKDYIGEGNAERRTSNEAAIKSAMDLLTADGRRRRVCLVLTQIDQYRELAKEKGGWLELTAVALPYVFGAHIKAQQVAVYPVSAVADTRVVVDADGTPRRVPQTGFKSDGLDTVVDWLLDGIRYLRDQRVDSANTQTQNDAPPPPPELLVSKRIRDFMMGVLFGTICSSIWLMIYCYLLTDVYRLPFLSIVVAIAFPSASSGIACGLFMAKPFLQPQGYWASSQDSPGKPRKWTWYPYDFEAGPALACLVLPFVSGLPYNVIREVGNPIVEMILAIMFCIIIPALLFYFSAIQIKRLWP